MAGLQLDSHFLASHGATPIMNLHQQHLLHTANARFDPTCHLATHILYSYPGNKLFSILNLILTAYFGLIGKYFHVHIAEVGYLRQVVKTIFR